MASKRRTSEAQFMKAISSPALSSKHLKDLVRATYRIQARIDAPIRVFPIGIPAPDGVAFETIVDSRRLVDLVNTILRDATRVRNFEVFPLGIPWPEQFRAKVHLH